MNKKTSKPGELFNPFPGLRPFNQEESHLFFGREGQSISVLESLESNKFVAVIGASGSGKSSLIYCGVIPGMIAKSKKNCVAVSTRPGTTPIRNLITALQAKFPKTVKETDADKLISGELPIDKWLKGFLPAGNTLLLVLDQFEEIFRFKKAEASENIFEEIKKFIELIHIGCTIGDNPIFVVLTMRSDFIGECSIFQDLTELINSSNYLIPQMTREDFRKAIEGPVKIGGATIDGNLVNQLLDEVGSDTDQLPVLQHSLMRTWDYWMLQHDPSKPINAGDYEAIGRMEKALSDHANEAYDELNEEQRVICEHLFKSITEKGGDNRGIRRPTRLDRIAKITKRTPEEIKEIVEVFREKGRTFLTPFQPVELTEDTVIDISHESLMRIWDRLRFWVDEEANSVQMYKKLSEAAELYQAGTAGLWRPPDLQLALNWRENQQPTATWAVQYNPAFERAMVYLDTSEKEYKKEEENKIRLQKRRLRITRIFSLVLGGIAIVAIGLFLYSQDLSTKAEAAALEAQRQSEIAVAQADTARIQTLEAQRQQQLAQAAQELATLQADTAKQQRELAVEASNLAQQQSIRAQLASDSAKQQALIAQQQSDLASQEAERARKAQEDAQRRQMLSIAQSMAVKSDQMLTDTLLKGLLAYQAYSFNTTYKGITYDPDIFSAAYNGLKFFKGEDYNVYTEHTDKINSLVQYSETIISGSSDGKVLKWNLENKTAEILLTDLPPVNKIIYNKQTLLCFTISTIVSYDLNTKHADTYEFGLPLVKDMFRTNDGQYILIYSQSIALTDNYKNKGKELFKSTSKIKAIDYDNNTGKLFVALSDGKIYVWQNLKSSDNTPEPMASIVDANWNEIRFNSRLNILAAGTGPGSNQGAIYLWDIKTGKQISILRSHTAAISSIEFNPEDSLMTSGSWDGSLNLWHLNDLNTLPIIYTDHPDWVTSVVFTADGKHVVTGDKKGNIKLFATDVNQLIAEYCDYLTRELTEAEWQNYVGTDIEYKPDKCNN